MPPARHGLDAPAPAAASDTEALSLRVAAAGALHEARRWVALPGTALSRFWPHPHSDATAPDPQGQSLLVRRHARLLMRALRRPLVGGNRLELLIDGPATYEAMFAAI